MSKTTVYKILVDKDQAIQSLKDLDEFQDELGSGFLALKSKINGGLNNPLKKLANTGNILKTKLLPVPKKIGLGFKSLQRKVNSFSFRRMQVHARRFERRMLAIPRRIRAGFSRLQNKLGGFGTALLGGFAVERIASGIGAAVTAASGRTEALNKSKTIFGNYFSDLEKFADKAATNIGLSKTAALETGSTFASLFKNTGLGADQVAKWSKASLQLGADLASFNNLNPEESMQALLSGLKGETEPLLKFGVVLDEARLKQKAFDMGLIKTFKGTMPKAIRTQAIFASVLDQTKDAQGDFNKTQDDYANSLRSLRAGWQDLVADGGKLLLPYMTSLVNWLKGSVAWIKENKDQVKSWIKIGGSLVTTLIAVWGAARLFMGARKMVRDIKLGYLLLNRALKGVRLSTIALNLVASVSPFGWIALAIGGIVLLIWHWDKVKVYMVALGKFLWKYHPFRWMINLIDKVFPGFKAALTQMFVWLVNKMTKVFNWLNENIFKPIKKFFLDELNESGLSPYNGSGGAGRPNRGIRKTITDKKIPGFDYGDLGLGNGSATDNGNNTNNPVKDRVNSLVSGAGNVKNINIQIGSLIENQSIRTEILKESVAEIKEVVSRVLLDAVNDINIAP